MKTLKTLLLLFFLTAAAQQAFAGRPPTLPNSYNGAAPGARSMAMGSAGTGLPITNEAFYYNAASLGNMFGTRLELGVVTSRSGEINPNFVAMQDPSGQGLISVMTVKDSGGISWQALSDNTINTRYIDGSWQKTETYINAITVSAGQKSEKGYNMGLNLTYLYGKIGESSFDATRNLSDSNIASGNGFALDLSFMFPVYTGLYFGLNVKNLAGFMFWDDYNYEQLPIIVRAGVGYAVKGFAIAIDWDKKFYRFGNLKENNLYAGIEQYLNGFICLRGGIITDEDFDTDNIQYSYGLGLKVKGYELAFAGQQYKIEEESFSKFLVSFSAMVF